jgi:hypothetical protein
MKRTKEALIRCLPNHQKEVQCPSLKFLLYHKGIVNQKRKQLKMERRMKFKVVFLVMIFILIVVFSSVFAEVPNMINYQGKITTPGGALVDTTVEMIFTIYDAATDGGVLWADTQSAVVVEKGVFSALLGSTNPIPDSVFDGSVRYLGVKVGNDPEMSPRKTIASVGYAVDCDMLDGKHGGQGNFLQVYDYGVVSSGTSKTLTIPHYWPWRLELSCGWPHAGGLCDILGFENDWWIGVTYVKYNGDGTSAAGGVEAPENSNTILVSFGSGGLTYTVECPNEAGGDHNIVLSASGGLELFYKLSW